MSLSINNNFSLCLSEKRSFPDFNERAAKKCKTGTEKPCLQDLEQIVERLEAQSNISADDIALIFATEEMLRDLSTPEEIILYNRLKPLMTKAKITLCQRRMATLSIQAAQRGKALQAGLRAMLANVGVKFPLCPSNLDSNQIVFLIPEQGAVLKDFKCFPRSREEENLIGQLALFKSSNMVPSFTLKRLFPKRFGIDLETDEEFFFAKLGEKNARRSGTIFFEIQNAYHQAKNKKWELLLDGVWRSYSLRDLQKVVTRRLFEKSIIHVMVRDEENKKEEMTLEEAKKHPLLGRALDYDPSNPLVAYVPNLNNDPKLKNSYEKFEKMGCIYKGRIIELSRGRFLLAKGEISSKDLICAPPINRQELENVLKVPFKPILLEALQENKRIGVPEPIENIQVKPFIKMRLFSHFYLCNNIMPSLEKILVRLDFQSILLALLTIELQFLDLHDNNIGFAPLWNEDCEKFKDMRFSRIGNVIYAAPKRFEELYLELHEEYLNNERVSVEYQDPETNNIVNGSVSNLPDLQKALNASWKLIIFDSDHSLREDNRLRWAYRFIKEQNCYEKLFTIPFRSFFLETEWSQSPLPDDVLEALENCQVQNDAMRKWARREDSPIRKRLSKECQVHLDQKLDLFLRLPKFNFSNQEGLSDKLFQDLRVLFASELCDQRTLLHACLIPLIQKGSSKKLEMEKLFKIGLELFPRLTWGQQKALIERQDKQFIYLRSYRKLRELNGDPEQTLVLISALVRLDDGTPLTTFQKECYVMRIKFFTKNQINSLKALENLRNDFLKDWRPTFFNLAKVAFPLLGDIFEIHKALYPSSAGEIGSFQYPIEKIIASVDSTKHGLDLYRLAKKLEKEIATPREI